MYSGSKNASSFDDAGVDNLDETPYLGVDAETGAESWAGLPSWHVLNFNVQYKVSEKIKLNIGVENILDVHYKTFGSGISAPGRSLICSAQYVF